MHRTNCSEMISNVLGPALEDEPIADLSGKKYALYLDESTDCCSTKHISICVRYLSEKKEQIMSDFWGLIPVTRSSGEELYIAIKSFTLGKELAKSGLQVKDCFGVATDGGSNMCGDANSVFSRFREGNPQCVLLKCICHSPALCGEKSFEL